MVTVNITADAGDIAAEVARLVQQAILHVDARDFEQADMRLMEALLLDSGHPTVAFHFARSAAERRDWNEVLLRWKSLAKSLGPDVIDLPIGLVEALRELGRLDEAFAIVKDALVHFVCDPRLLPSVALLMMSRRDMSKAMTCWRRYLQSFPGDLGASQWLAVALIELGAYDEADAVLGEVLDARPDDSWSRILSAQAKTFAGHWEAAYTQWRAIEHPSSEPARAKFRETMHALRLAAVDERASSDALSNFKQISRPSQEELAKWERDLEKGSFASPFRDLMFQFESLGGGCEFGLVQRHYDAEPLGLLRWAYIPHHSLVSGLRDRFLGVGDAGQTRVEVYKGDEYAVVDSRHNFRTHTQIFIEHASPEQVLAQQTRRLGYLRGKLISDLQNAEKIFVYGAVKRLSDAQIESLFSALRAYSDNWLLCVRPEEAGHPSATVEQPHPRLFIAYIDAIWPGDITPISYGAWLSICRRVAGLRSSA